MRGYITSLNRRTSYTALTSSKRLSIANLLLQRRHENFETLGHSVKPKVFETQSAYLIRNLFQVVNI